MKLFVTAAVFLTGLPAALGITILPRSSWAAKITDATERAKASTLNPSANTAWNPDRGVFIHYRGSILDPSTYANEDECKDDIADVWKEHTKKDAEYGGDIAYNFIVCKHGNIYQARGYERGEANGGGKEGNYGRNTAFYSIMGLMNTGQSPTEAMLRSMRDLIQHLRTAAPTGRRVTENLIFPHSHEWDTLCPGNLEMYAQPGSTIDPSAPWSGIGDVKVYEAQKFANDRYVGRAVGYVKSPINGKTSWSTVYSLTQGLQYELGISPTVQNFGTGTFNAIKARNKLPHTETNQNIIQLYNAALWCKGYPGAFDQSQWDMTRSQVALERLWTNSGLGSVSSRLTMWPHLCRALFRMDQFELVPGGSEATRSIQQWLNSRYVASVGIPAMILVPCDGIYSRDVQLGFMMGVQYELGIPSASVTGNFGPGTESNLRGVGSRALTGNLRYLFRAACVFNSPVPGPNGVLYYSASDTKTDALTSTHVAWLDAFQKFSQIPVTKGANDYTTWAQLLVSHGDRDRNATACDCITEITASRGAALKAAGYHIVGRYLDEAVPPSSPYFLDKALKPTEPQTILAAGLRFFPIFQYGGSSSAAFDYDIGKSHASIAHDKATGLRIPAGTCIYFSVDYDATDYDLDEAVIPYFKGVRDMLASKGGKYKHCVYGPRNICTRVSKETGAVWSFVSGMSSGFSGNMGFPMPENWSFNQIKEFNFAGAGGFGLDNDVWRTASDPGVSRLG